MIFIYIKEINNIIIPAYIGLFSKIMKIFDLINDIKKN